MENQNMRILIFAVYSILYEVIVLGGTGYAVFVLGQSGWWFALAVLMSGAQLTQKHFGIKMPPEANK